MFDYLTEIRRLKLEIFILKIAFWMAWIGLAIVIVPKLARWWLG